MSEITSLTAQELIELLSKNPTAKVFMSRDSEGNGYNSLSEGSVEHNVTDDVILLYPAQEHLEWDEVLPKAWEQEEEDGRDV